ncbi:MAG: S8 family peptidase [Saprospiraceae bacterium]
MHAFFTRSVFLFSLILVASFGLTAQSTIDPLLRVTLSQEGDVDVLVMFESFPDLSGAKALATKEEKGRFVFEALQQNAQQHEAVLSELAQRGIAHQHFISANAVYVPQADAALVGVLSTKANVFRISQMAEWRMHEIEAVSNTNQLESRAVTPEWGLRYMGVPEVWAQGIRGSGATVGGQDTGYDWTHPALQEKYRGFRQGDTAVHDYNWHDAIHERSPLNSDDNNPCGYDSRFPCDDGDHGTHTMGTMIGSDNANEVGVAPEAKWVACRSMERGWGRPQSYLECFEWFLAPTDLNGDNPRPELAPDVIANSWYCPEQEGCDTSTYPAFDNITAALRAAGVVVVVSAGNDGRSGCNTVNRIPAQSPGVIAVGAHDSLGQIANFSSRGTDEAPLNGPDIAAPGVAVRSTVPGDAYGSKGGTSMAGPHVAGLVALMISARPELRGQVDTIEALLFASAVETAASPSDTCSAPGGVNQVFGNGTASAIAAVNAALNWGGVSNTAYAKTFVVRVAPNPVGDRFMIELPGEAIGGTLRVLDGVGRLVYQAQIAQSMQFVDSADWVKGTYFYQVESVSGVASGKLIR